MFEKLAYFNQIVYICPDIDEKRTCIEPLSL